MLLGKMSESEEKYELCKFSLKVFRSAARFCLSFLRQQTYILHEIVLSQSQVHPMENIKYRTFGFSSIAEEISLKFKSINLFSILYVLYYAIFCHISKKELEQIFGQV